MTRFSGPRMSLSLTFFISSLLRRATTRWRSGIASAAEGEETCLASAAFSSSSFFLRSSSSFALRRTAVLAAAMRCSAMLAPTMVAFTAAGSYFDSRSVEFYGERQSGAHVGRCGPSRVEWQVRAELIDLGDQPLFDVAGVVAEQHGVAQKPWQTFEALVPVGRVSRRSGRDSITLDLQQISVIGVVARTVRAHASSSDDRPIRVARLQRLLLTHSDGDGRRSRPAAPPRLSRDPRLAFPASSAAQIATFATHSHTHVLRAC